ncbi:hypothetical protein E2C01_010036 [Portunus trituberculatus]|uniref:Uncharacterized protein n=1 Tax=Portunus trituberculatus TaxID=210409 RepID=A0A5B7D7D7_PORTR|nr:hypothetical protein [Portunus trituberculatus]
MVLIHTKTCSLRWILCRVGKYYPGSMLRSQEPPFELRPLGNIFHSLGFRAEFLDRHTLGTGDLLVVNLCSGLLGPHPERN